MILGGPLSKIFKLLKCVTRILIDEMSKVNKYKARADVYQFDLKTKNGKE